MNKGRGIDRRLGEERRSDIIPAVLPEGEGRLLNSRYKLLERFGSGGMANVFRGRDMLLDRLVAIKVLREDHGQNPDFNEQFRHEAQAAANLSHPNIVTVYDFGFDHGQPFIVMELVPGTDLKSLLRKRGRFTIEEGIPLMVQACAGIGYAHRAGLVHCDVKPHNMLVTPDNRLKVTDFGIARALASIAPSEHSEVVWGSPQYFSPEQAAGQAPSPASDVYSLGVVMYEMLTGTLPFTGSTAEELARAHLMGDPMPPSEYVPDLPRLLEQIIMKVLSKEPSARYRTADQLGRVLLKFGTQRDIPIITSSLAPTPEVAAPAIWDEGPSTSHSSTSTSTQTEDPFSEPAEPANIDWTGVVLGLLAVLAVGGLIPLALWVYFVYHPVLR